MSLQSLIVSSFTLTIAIFEKALASNPSPFRKPCCVYEIFNGEFEESQLPNCMTYWNAQTNRLAWVKKNTKVCKFKRED